MNSNEKLPLSHVLTTIDLIRTSFNNDEFKIRIIK